MWHDLGTRPILLGEVEQQLLEQQLVLMQIRRRMMMTMLLMMMMTMLLMMMRTLIRMMIASHELELETPPFPHRTFYFAFLCF